MKLSIVIPAYNEELRIGRTLRSYLKFFSSQSVEFIIVLNGCRDRTYQVVGESFYNSKANYKVLNIKNAVGKGAAVREGFKVAEGDLIGFVDADGATSPEEYSRLVSRIGSGVDGAIASRWKRGSRIINRTLFRKFVSLFFVLLVRVVVGLPYLDTQCGAKVFKKKVIRKLLSYLRIENMAFDVEILKYCQIFRYNIEEVPTVWKDDRGSNVFKSPMATFKIGWKMLNTLFQIRKIKI